jgi:hypothetical protein
MPATLDENHYHSDGSEGLDVLEDQYNQSLGDQGHVVRKMLRRYESLIEERVDLEIKIQDEKNQQDKIAYLKKKALKEIEEMKK